MAPRSRASTAKATTAASQRYSKPRTPTSWGSGECVHIFTFTWLTRTDKANADLRAALHLYFMVEAHKGNHPDFALLAKVMRVLGSPTSDSALQQQLEKAFRTRVKAEASVLDEVCGTSLA
jgi:hypothetical protein